MPSVVIPVSLMKSRRPFFIVLFYEDFPVGSIPSIKSWEKRGKKWGSFYSKSILINVNRKAAETQGRKLNAAWAVQFYNSFAP